jgi:hypothetical protein
VQNDVDLASNPDPVAVARVGGLYEVLKRLAWAPLIVAAAAPLEAMAHIATALAGKHTDLNITATVSVAVGLTGVGWGALNQYRNHLMRKALATQRTRLERIENENKRLKGEVKNLKAGRSPRR